MIGVGTSAATQNTPQTAPAKSLQKAEAAPADKVSADKAAAEVCATDNTDKARDPFEPQTLPKLPGSDKNQTNTRPPIHTAFTPLSPMIPILSGGSLMTRSGINDVQKDPLKELRLTGVVTGGAKLAIIRGGENRRYIVREGQFIEGNIRIERISSDRVRVRLQDRIFVLRLGGNQSSENAIHA